MEQLLLGRRGGNCVWSVWSCVFGFMVLKVLDCCICSKEEIYCVSINNSLKLDFPLVQLLHTFGRCFGSDSSPYWLKMLTWYLFFLISWFVKHKNSNKMFGLWGNDSKLPFEGKSGWEIGLKGRSWMINTKELEEGIGKACYTGFAVLHRKLEIFWLPFLGGSFNICLVLKGEWMNSSVFIFTDESV